MADRVVFPDARDGDARRDARTGLLWETRPAATEAPWHVARASAVGAWRLPSAVELMAFLAALPSRHPFPVPRGAVVFWSSSESPFAPAAHVRAVAWTAGRPPSVLLLDKSFSARCWRVRAEAGS